MVTSAVKHCLVGQAAPFPSEVGSGELSAAQGSVALRPERGKLGADFNDLGTIPPTKRSVEPLSLAIYLRGRSVCPPIMDLRLYMR
jgi:hypothetical protein